MGLSDLAWGTLQDFLLNDKKHSAKPQAVQANKSRFKKLKGYFADKDFNRANFGQFMGWLTSQNYSNSYKNNFVKIGKIVEKYLEITSGRRRELTDFTYYRENKEFEGQCLTPEEIRALYTVKIRYPRGGQEQNRRNEALITLLGTTGCRVSEALDLEFVDVRNDPVPHVIFRDVKFGGNRRVVISQTLYTLLTALRKRNRYVFTSDAGLKLRSQEVVHDLKKRAGICGIKKNIYCHLLRHSFITTMLANDVDSLSLAQLVGHKDTRTTLRYSHPTLERMAEVIQAHPLIRGDLSMEEKMDRVLRKLKTEGSVTYHQLEGNKLTATIDLN